MRSAPPRHARYRSSISAQRGGDEPDPFLASGFRPRRRLQEFWLRGGKA